MPRHQGDGAARTAPPAAWPAHRAGSARLLTAAQGGLSGPDLAALTGAPSGRSRSPTWSVRAYLHPAGEHVATRARPRVYLLGHEELQATAQAYFGDQRLAATRTACTPGQRIPDRSWPLAARNTCCAAIFRCYCHWRCCTAGGVRRRRRTARVDARYHRRRCRSAQRGRQRPRSDHCPGHPDLTAALRLARHRDTLPTATPTFPQAARRVGHSWPIHPRRGLPRWPAVAASRHRCQRFACVHGSVMECERPRRGCIAKSGPHGGQLAECLVLRSVRVVAVAGQSKCGGEVGGPGQ